MFLDSSFYRAANRLSLARWKMLVARIIRQSDSFTELSNSELRATSLSLKYQVLSGLPLERALPTAYALIREASRRTLSMAHFPVQLLGAIAMHHGCIGVMQTGEGKTLTATLPLFLSALNGRGAHLITSNDYLAQRDANQMRPIFESLGMSVGVVAGNSTQNERQKGYHSDITYSTAKEIGFDFLRDRLAKRDLDAHATDLVSRLTTEEQSGQNSNLVQRQFEFVLVDEADSILIDEARTPLIISGPPDHVSKARAKLYRWAFQVQSNLEHQVHFRVDSKSKQVELTPAGRMTVRKLPQPAALKSLPIADLFDQLELALFVEQNYVKDRQYVVRQNEIVIVDEFTGRLAEGRKWRDGLHQAIEAREGIELSFETSESARITVQDLFLRYHRLAGMTGTAANSDAELRKIYRLSVARIPTNRPPKRDQWPTMVFGSEIQKWEAIVAESEQMFSSNRPVLIGTRSIDKSEIISGLLANRKIPHQVLNAKNLSKEAQIVAEAGQLGKVTVATNMAGRGTDIKISEEVLLLGGLHVICSELHDSARIDRQLIGRCGRQGDPGSFRQFLSLEDEILRTAYGSEFAQRLNKYQKYSNRSLKRFERLFYSAQRKLEKLHFQGRKMLMHHEGLRKDLQQEMGQDPYLDTAGAA
ncbi:MAG: DEAD/DEAH box helicase [Planctomycetota bacterium]